MAKQTISEELSIARAEITDLERRLAERDDQLSAIKNQAAVMQARLTAERDVQARMVDRLLGIMGAVVQPGGARPVGTAAIEDRYAVVLRSYGDKKINTIKAVRVINPGLGLKEAKDLVEGAPAFLRTDLGADQAQQILRDLQEWGADVELVNMRWPGEWAARLASVTGG